MSVQVLPPGLFGLFVTPRLEKLREVRAGRKEEAINCLPSSSVTDASRRLTPADPCLERSGEKDRHTTLFLFNLKETQLFKLQHGGWKAQVGSTSTMISQTAFSRDVRGSLGNSYSPAGLAWRRYC